MRMHPAFITLPVLVSAALIAGTPALAGTPGRPGPQPAAVSPASRVIDDVLNGDSCTTQPDNPAITSACITVGFFADGPFVSGLMEASSNGTWGGNTFGGLGSVTDPFSVSCVPQPENIPVCVAVGEHYKNPAYPQQLVATGGANGFSPVTFGDPKGDNWSVLNDVSCASATFCMMVGSDGKARKTAHGVRYTTHASAYRWNGSARRQLKVPAPAHAKASQLGGVSCPTATSCMAVGIYTGPAGRTRPYSVLWTGGAWHLRTVRAISGKATTVPEAVSCSAAATCTAVGEAVTKGRTAFAERFAGGKWTVQHIAAEARSGFFSVSCPSATACVAVGQRGTRSLAEAWNGTRWAAQAVPQTGAPRSTDALQHVSCITAAICTAAGYQHNPQVRYAYRTLAAGWNGSRWAIQKTFNQ